MAATKFQVISFSRSPMNAKRWLCRLACNGHCEVWVTRSKRPILGTTLLPCPNGHISMAEQVAKDFGDVAGE